MHVNALLGNMEYPEIAGIYLWDPSKIDSKKIVNLHRHEHNIDGMLEFHDIIKFIGQHVQLHRKDNFRRKRVMQPLGWKWLLTTIFGFGTIHLGFQGL